MARYVSKTPKRDYYKELDRRIAELPTNEDLDELSPSKAVDASPKELAKVLFEIADDCRLDCSNI